MAQLTKLKNKILDESVVFSYDRGGYQRHALRFEEGALERDLSERVALVTGANSGIGKETAAALAGRGAETWLLCRNAERAESARREINFLTGNDRVFTATIDLSDSESIRRFVAGFERDKVDILVHNAGVLPDEELMTPDGLELTVATNLVGPFLLTWLLRERLLRSEDGRLIHVTSGGMYSRKLSVERLGARGGRFDGVTAYADTKRALVVLNEQLAERFTGTDVTVHATHPGWADTPAVRSSLPRFWKLARSILRTPAQGADTVVWLAVAPEAKEQTGRLWFDREPQRTHLVSWTKESVDERERLWRQLCDWIGVDADADWGESEVRNDN